MPARSANALISRKSTDRPLKIPDISSFRRLAKPTCSPGKFTRKRFRQIASSFGHPSNPLVLSLCGPHFPRYDDILRSHGPYDRDSPVRKFLEPVMHSHAR